MTNLTPEAKQKLDLYLQRMRTELRPTGIRPALTDRLASRGIQLPSAWFGYTEPSEIGA